MPCLVYVFLEVLDFEVLDFEVFDFEILDGDGDDEFNFAGGTMVKEAALECDLPLGFLSQYIE